MLSSDSQHSTFNGSYLLITVNTCRCLQHSGRMERARERDGERESWCCSGPLQHDTWADLPLLNLNDSCLQRRTSRSQGPRVGRRGATVPPCSADLASALLLLNHTFKKRQKDRRRRRAKREEVKVGLSGDGGQGTWGRGEGGGKKL